MGALQFGMGALANIALSALSDGTAVPMARVILGCALLAVAVNLLGRRVRSRAYGVMGGVGQSHAESEG